MDEVHETIGPFEILDELGEGGMGIVYLAQQTTPVRRQVALKVIKLGMDTEQVLTRFEVERQALAMMEHDNIAKVLDAGSTRDGRPYFAMEYVRGMPITEYCNRHRLRIGERLRLFRQVCAGVQHAHQKGVIHRDLKPSNVLVSKSGGVPSVKIIDFGVARATDHRLVEQTLYTELGQFIGTPEYMSPEQAGLDGLDLDTRSDVYSLGTLLYVMLTDQLPFPSEQLRQAGLVEIQRTIRELDPPRPSNRCTDSTEGTQRSASRRRVAAASLARRLRGDLDWITLKALEKDRTRRYQTAQQLSEDIRRHLEHEPVLAGPPSASYRVKKLLLRYRTETAVAGLVIVLLVTGTIVSWAFYMAEEEQRRNAEASAVTARANEAEARRQEDLAKRENSHYERLSVLVKLQNAEALYGELTSTWPETTASLEAWQSAGQLVIDEIPRVLATRRQLDAKARPANGDESVGDGTSEDRRREIAGFRKKVAALQRAMKVRLGTAQPEDEELPSDAPKDARGLNTRAWPYVDPDRPPGAHGQEALGLALARRAVAVADPRDKSRCYHLDTLAWAMFANGLDAEARAKSAAAVAAAPATLKVFFETMSTKLAQSIDDTAWTLSWAELQLNEKLVWRFADDSDRFLHRTMLRAERGVLAFTGPGGMWRDVQTRLSWARRIPSLTQDHPNARVTWKQARAAIKKADGIAASALYANRPIDLKPQIGLVPIGMNPTTKLWEFYHLRSAWDPLAGRDPGALEIPVHAEDGSIAMAEASGIVFVLLPGGDFVMGAQKQKNDGPNFDPWAGATESPHRESLPPFFMARHELTQGQWSRLTAIENPSNRAAGKRSGKWTVDLRHPVERVDWHTSRDLLKRYGLELPANDAWEYACRAGTNTVWHTGDVESGLIGFANLFDTATKKARPTWSGVTASFADEYEHHAPVGSFLPNDFGLYDMHGNVAEWSESLFGSAGHRSYRGGSYRTSARSARSAAVRNMAPTTVFTSVGMRASRALRN